MTAKPPIPRTPAEEELLARFDTAPNLSTATALRRGALARFKETGLPHRRVESYKYTDLKRLIAAVPPIGAVPDATVAAAALKAAPVWSATGVKRLVFVDGHFCAALSDTAIGAGVALRSLQDVLSADGDAARHVGWLPIAEPDTALALNTAFMQDGAVIDIAAGTDVEAPIELVHLTTGEVATYPRHSIRVGEGARVAFVETFAGSSGAAYQVNAAVEIDLAAKASVSWLKRQDEGGEALHLSSMVVRCAAGAEYKQSGFAMGAKVSRAQTFLTFAGAAASATLNTAVLAQHRQHHDTTMVIDHAVGGCASREAVKTVVDDGAKGIFQGRIIVRPDAQQTDGRMMSRSLLLTEGGEAVAKPELEIYADDVQCAHGATSGEIDADMLFYLMARGIPHDAAERMLIAAFLQEIVDGIEIEGLRNTMAERVDSWLSARGSVA